MSYVLGIPPTIVNLVQSGMLEREFHDGLYPENLYRDEAEFEQWPAGTGAELYMSKPGLITPKMTPLVPGVDPVPSTVNWEQWRIALERYGDSIDTNMQTSTVSIEDTFLRNIKQLGLNAGQVLNRLPRNVLHQSYLSGNTCLVDAGAAIDVQIHLASLNGFSDLILVGTDTKPTAVSATHPLPISIGIGAALIVRNVIAVLPDDATDPNGPGWALLSVALGAVFAARTPVISAYASQILRVGGGLTVDAIGAADTFVMQNAIVASSLLRQDHVPPHEDGFYHAHIPPTVVAQAFSDVPFQRLFTGLPNAEEIKKGVLGTIGRVKFIENSDCPIRSLGNVGTLTATGLTGALYAKDVGADVTNNAGIDIGRVLVTGKGSLYERGLDEGKFVTEAGITGKVKDFEAVQNGGMTVQLDRIKLILRAPVNRLQDEVAATWSCSTGFAAPSDACSGGSARWKRAKIIECAI